MRRRPRRVSGGRVEAWRATFTVGRTRRGEIFKMLLALAAPLAFINVVYFPSYLSGLATGVLLTGAAWAITWQVWVSSGNGSRLNGLWAEDATNEALRDNDRVYATVPSLKFGQRDIDAVAITPSSVLAIETKWSGGALDIERTCDRAARDARTLRLSLQNRGLTEDLVRAVVVVWGPLGRQLNEHVVHCSLGDVTVVPGHELEAWLSRTPNGPIGPDYAAKIGDELHTTAKLRDGLNVDAGPLLRWLGRTR
jgi:hypothetical protein